MEKVKEIQTFLEKRGIIVSETSIENAAIKIATRWNGYAVFISEFERRDDR